MIFSLSWLKKFLQTEAEVQQITNMLNALGLEVESVMDRAQELASFIVAEVLMMEPHPKSKKLKICEVFTGSEKLRIVCGAGNVRPGLKTVFAPIGTSMPNTRVRINVCSIAGVDSYGMLCSAQELGIDGDDTGIIELNDAAVPGDMCAKYLGVDDPVIKVAITPNRSDCMSVYGIARELAAKGLGKLVPIARKNVLESFQTKFKVDIESSHDCPLFIYREIKNIINRPSPLWLRKILETACISPVSAVVDIINYLCLSFGHPMHVYDADKLQLDLRVARALEETFIGLNGSEYNLSEQDIVIKSDKGIHALAGILGSISSSCSSSTTNIVLESAEFACESVGQSGRRLKLMTDAQVRFERGVDRSFVHTALELASDMIINICGGEASRAISIGQEDARTSQVKFPVEIFAKKIGYELHASEISNILRNIGCLVEIRNDYLVVTPPSWRHDINIAEDVLEEVIRVIGYNHIPSVPIPMRITTRILSKTQRNLQDIKRVVASLGYNEVVTWSFMDSGKASLFGDLRCDLYIANPISSDLNYMRHSIMPNLLDLIIKNAAKRRDVAIFEVGPVFYGTTPEDEQTFITGARSGEMLPKNPHTNTRKVDVFDIKGDIESILRELEYSIYDFTILSDAPKYYHPSRSATIMCGGICIGYFGEIHPQVVGRYDITEPVFGFELNLSAIPCGEFKYGKREYSECSSYPCVSRDLAFIVDADEPVGPMVSVLRTIDKEHIKEVFLFDVYSGENIASGKKSVAFSLRIQSNYKTLTDAEIRQIVDVVIKTVESKFNAVLRSE